MGRDSLAPYLGKMAQTVANHLGKSYGFLSKANRFDEQGLR